MDFSGTVAFHVQDARCISTANMEADSSSVIKTNSVTSGCSVLMHVFSFPGQGRGTRGRGQRIRQERTVGRALSALMDRSLCPGFGMCTDAQDGVDLDVSRTASSGEGAARGAEAAVCLAGGMGGIAVLAACSSFSRWLSARMAHAVARPAGRRGVDPAVPLTRIGAGGP